MNIGGGESLHTGNMPPDDRSHERLDLDLPPAGEPHPPLSTLTSGKAKAAYAPPKPAVEIELESTPPSGRETQSQSPPIRIVEASQEDTDEALAKAPPKRTISVETDFYRKPTLLSRLVLSQKYGGAIRRVYTEPEEASIWVCAKRVSKGGRKGDKGTPDTIYSIRQLPIHIACSNLTRTHDFKLKKLLNELISTLIFSNPEGAHEEDHKGRFPLHEAIWYGAAPDTIALFLMAKPSSIKLKDKLGRSLIELNQHRTGFEKEAIEHLLNRGVDFWKKARKEANIRLKHNFLSFPSEGNSLGSMSNVASSAADAESILTSHSQQPEVGPEEIPPISWDQLEKRSIATEQVLTEINIRNYELSKKVEALTTIDQVQGSQLVKELTRLNQENGLLSVKLQGIETLLIKTLTHGDEDQDRQYRLALAEISSLMGLSEKSSISKGSQEPALSVTREARKLHKELSQKHFKQRERVRKLKHVVEELIVKHNNDTTGASSSDAMSTISALTSHSAKSNYSYSGSSINRTPDKTKPIDDLDLILSYAAARDQAKRVIDLDLPPRKEEDNSDDDLSRIIRWAASNDDTRTGAKRSRPSSVTSSWSPVTPTGRRNQRALKKMQSWHNRDLTLPALLPKVTKAAIVRERVEDVGLERSGLTGSIEGEGEV